MTRYVSWRLTEQHVEHTEVAYEQVNDCRACHTDPTLVYRIPKLDTH